MIAHRVEENTEGLLAQTTSQLSTLTLQLCFYVVNKNKKANRF